MADLRCSYWRPDPPDLENRAMGFFWGVDRDCLVPVDRGSDKQTFFCAFQKKIGKIFTGFSDPLYRINRSGVVELVGRDRLLFATVEIGVTNFPQKKSSFGPKKLRAVTGVRMGRIISIFGLEARKSHFWGV